MGELYRLHFPNGKSYVGITTKTARKRFVAHGVTARMAIKAVGGPSDRAIHRAWRKYGSPQLETIAVVENAELAETEIRAIKAFNTLVPYGYNLSYGGDMSPMLNPIVAAKVRAALIGRKASAETLAKLRLRPFSPEHRAKLRAAAKNISKESREKAAAATRGRPRPKELMARIAAKRVGIPLTAEHRAKLSKAMMGKVPTAETREKLAAARRGYTHTDQTKARMSAAQKRVSPEVRARIAALNTGKKHTAESRAQMSRSRKAYFARLRDAGPEGQLSFL